ncbi:MAG: amidohydrolase family protein [Oscillospiraceae bacterium]|jgi:predicted TIM-barrel fold metal-dependent hydrolase|nr:amidohydrolase family protein [Oscillospiraceae bacterium]
MSVIHKSAKAGIPLSDVYIIDEHCHLGFFGGQYMGGVSPEAMLAEMDSLGVDIAILSHSMAIISDFTKGNDLVFEAVNNYPDRFLGYCTVNPLYPDEMLFELERCAANPGIKGIKLHPYCHERPLSYKHYNKAYKFASENKLFVMSHTYTAEDIETTNILAAEFSDTVFIMAHMGGEKMNVETALDVINRRDNVFGDISGSQAWEGVIEWYVSEVGSKKIIYGTDTPFMNPTATFALLAMSEINDDEKRDIFGLNMKRIIESL